MNRWVPWLWPCGEAGEWQSLCLEEPLTVKQKADREGTCRSMAMGLSLQGHQDLVMGCALTNFLKAPLSETVIGLNFYP